MTGWLIHNKGFINEHNLKQYNLYKDACDKYGVNLVLKSNFDINIVLSEISEFRVDETSKPDFVLFLDKDINLAKQLELLGFNVFNSAYCLETCDNKNLTHLVLSKKGIKTPKTILSKLDFSSEFVLDEKFNEFIVERLGFPLVVKEAYGSFGQQVYLIKNNEELILMQEKLYKTEHLYQQFVPSSYGKDIRVYVVNNEVKAAILRCNKNDFRANITNGGSVSEFKITDDVKEIAIKAAEAVNADFAGVDILFGEGDELIVCEVNSNAYFVGLFSLNGINIANYIIECIVEKIKK